MRLFARPLLALAAVAAIACGDSVEPGFVGPPRESLNGEYHCATMYAVFVGPNGYGPATSSCNGYHSLTNPNRADSLESKPFTVNASGAVTIIDFPNSQLSYDSTSGTARITVPGFGVLTYRTLVSAGGAVSLQRRLDPFDFTGDGKIDSLVLTFTKATN